VTLGNSANTSGNPARRERDVGPVELRRHGDGVERFVDEQRQLGECSDDVDDDDCEQNVSDGTQLLGQRRVTDADISTGTDETHQQGDEERYNLHNMEL